MFKWYELSVRYTLTSVTIIITSAKYTIFTHSMRIGEIVFSVLTAYDV